MGIKAFAYNSPKIDYIRINIEIFSMNSRTNPAPKKAPKFIRANRLSGSHRHRAGGDVLGLDDLEKPVASKPSRPPKNLEKPTIASTLRAASIRNKALAHTLACAPACGSPVQRKTGGGVLRREKPEENQNEEMNKDKVTSCKLLDIGVQTNEAEILNHELLVGDVKLLMPSDEIVKGWEETSKRLTMRKFEDYEQDEEQHLDELKQFMERNYVTRRKPKKPPVLPTRGLNQFSNVFKSMDEFFMRDIPRTESITTIKERIHHKEVELMTMFDDVTIDEKSETESEVV